MEPEHQENSCDISHTDETLVWNHSYNYFSAKSDYADLLSDRSESLFPSMKIHNNQLLFSSFDYIRITCEDNTHNTRTYANLLIESLDLWFTDIKKHLLTRLLCRRYSRALKQIDKFIIGNYIGPQSFDRPYLTEHNFLDWYKVLSQRYFDRMNQVTYALMGAYLFGWTSIHYFHADRMDIYKMKYRLVDSLNCQNIFKDLWYRRVLSKLKSFETLLNL